MPLPWWANGISACATLDRTANRPRVGHDADLTKGIFDGPAAHGFDYARFTSRSHGTSGLDAGTTVPKSAKKKGGNQNTPGKKGTRPYSRQPDHGANGNGKQLVEQGPHAYDFIPLAAGIRIMQSLSSTITSRGKDSSANPSFSTYPSNSNHGPYTPDKKIGDKAVKGAGRTMSAKATSIRRLHLRTTWPSGGCLTTWKRPATLGTRGAN